jgi:pyridoxal phosphate enzyme (YggS family)
LSIRARLAEVRGRVAAAARSAGRDPADIRLVAVSKTFPPEAVLEAAEAGQTDFGENRVQEALQKQQALQKIARSADLPIRWHLLGHLQANKARKAAPAFAVIQSVDGVDLLNRLDRAAVDAGCEPELLIQVDLAGEATKFGAAPADVPGRGRRGHEARCRAGRPELPHPLR